MKVRIEELGITCNKCESDGLIKFKEEIDIELIKSLMDSAKRAKTRIKKDTRSYEKETKDYTFIFRDNYEILRTLIDAFLLFDKVKADNHQCSNAHLCTKHSELELDWDTLESIRILRNGINYEGKTVDLEKWNKFKLQFEIYINTLTREIEKKLEER
ncbi:hypothetical protein KY366_03615 [Candidatus Woesearchaeota archaeon]|nr:hypothetical protein [Candidatus Woesearchaeota archaeon]